MDAMIKKLKEQYGLRDWWASEVVDGGMTMEEAIASQKARDAFVAQLQESGSSEQETSVEAFLQKLKFAESLH